MTIQQTFEEAIAEYLERCQEQIGKERMEGLPPGPPSPYDQSGPPYESPLRLDARTIRNYALSIGDDNPIFTDPEYGKRTRYGSQIAPGPIMVVVRAGGGQGPMRPQGYPVADFVAGTAWEFYDVIHVGTGPIRSSKTDREVFQKQGSRGGLIFLICELFYRNAHGDLPAKAYGTLIMVPTESMGSSRAMSVDRLGEQMMYDRGTHRYQPDDIAGYMELIGKPKRRGAETLHWEDVEVGQELDPLVLPPWTLQDQIANNLARSLTGRNPGTRDDELAFEQIYHSLQSHRGGARTHPVSMWPWTPNSEHEDALLAAYRGQSGPFDHGVQRFQIPQQLLTNWMGDDGFVRRYQTAIRRPVYYGDVTIYRGRIAKKFTERQTGENAPGAASGDIEYNAVGIRMEGVNQTGELQAQGTAVVYLPSRKTGHVHLPVPHLAQPPYVPYETFYRDWF